MSEERKPRIVAYQVKNLHMAEVRTASVKQKVNVDLFEVKF